MLLQQVEKSSISDNMNNNNLVNTQSNRDSEINASPIKKPNNIILKPPKDEEKLQLNNKDNTTDDGLIRKKGCCGG